MATYELTFYFYYGGGVLWSLNDAARTEYGYFVDLNRLTLSADTIRWANEMSEEYQTRLDWDKPNANKPIWPKTIERDFKKRSRLLFKQMSNELGRDYIVLFNNHNAQSKGFKVAMIEKGFKPESVLNDLIAMVVAVAPYFDGSVEGTNYDDYVYKGNHIRIALGRDGNIISFYPLDNYTPNFHPDKLKTEALAAEPYDKEAPELNVWNAGDPDNARKMATFSREILAEHYGTDDMSKWV